MAAGESNGGSFGPTEYGSAGESLRNEAKNWARGAAGEDHTAAALRALSPEYHVFHTITIGSGGADIDHLVIGPTGVWVIDSKFENYPYSVRNGQLKSGTKPRDLVITKVEEYAALARHRLGVDTNATISVVGEFTTGPAAMVGRVRVIDHRYLAGHILNSPRVLSEDRVRHLAQGAEEWKNNPARHFQDNKRFRSQQSQRTRRLSPVPPPLPAPPRPASGPVTTSGDKSDANAGGCLKAIGVIVLALFAIGAITSAAEQFGFSASPTTTEAPFESESGESVAGAEATVPEAPLELDLEQLEIEFVCSELNGTYWMRLRIADMSAGQVHVSVSVSGVEQYLGEYRWGEPIEAIANLGPSTPITVTASWTSRDGSTPGDLKRSFTAPSAACT